MHGDLLDLILLGVAALFAVSGYSEGLLVGVASTVGFIGGGLAGAKLAPQVASALAIQRSPLIGLLVVFLAAVLGQVVLTAIGVAIRRRVLWSPARALDSLLGAVLSVGRLLLLAYLVGIAVFQSGYRSLASEISHSEILTTVGRMVPPALPGAIQDFIRLFGRQDFPQIFAGLGGAPAPVAPPDPALANSRAVVLAERTVVKVRGDAPTCSRSLEGSGFIYAAGRVMTNAHVVAGVTDPTVTTADGVTHRSRVVLFDPVRDVAVLAVPGLATAPLGFAPATGAGAGGVVVGYPENGPFTAVPARVRDREQIHSPDIYGQGDGLREVYAIRAVVRPGNSGGPLLTASGQVLGVVFAAATDDPQTGYALTATEVAGDAAAGAGASATAGTQGCD